MYKLTPVLVKTDVNVKIFDFFLIILTILHHFFKKSMLSILCQHRFWKNDVNGITFNSGTFNIS